MESKKINQLATELTPSLSDLTIIGDPSTGISKKITLSQMASLFTGTVEEYANLAAFPLVGVADTIYIALDTNVLYRYNTGTNAYVELSPNIINSLVFNDANGFDGTIALVGSVATLTITTALTTGSVGFIGASGALLQDNANFFFDDTNNRLGLGTNAPTTALDVFGSGIIGRLNGTSTNNAFLGFASAGTNRWSIGNVQADHRFRIYNEATTSELVSVLSTGEFGIGIANPTTKLHIDGGSSALIANLDANVSVAKSLSFRSDNSNRINLEVSGTESGSNAGANIFLRTFTDAGSLLETPFSIVRSTGVTTIKSLTLTNALSVANGGTGSTTQNFVDLTTTQSIAGLKTFTNNLSAIKYIANAQGAYATLTYEETFKYATSNAGIWFGNSFFANGNAAIQLRTSNDGTSVQALTLNPTGTANFVNSVSALKYIGNAQATYSTLTYEETFKYATSNAGIWFGNSFNNNGNVGLQLRVSNDGASVQALTLNQTGAATFSSGIGISGATATTAGIQFPISEVNVNNANNLDDYEEGAFTPVVLGNSTPGTASYSAQNGRYVKTGRQVTFNLYCDWNGGNGTGTLLIGGLPYVADAVATYPACAIGETSAITLGASGIMTARVQISDNKIFIQQYPVGGGTASSVSYDGTGYVVLSGIYYV